jgi:transcriptional regulator with XRE-family HTH domain
MNDSSPYVPAFGLPERLRKARAEMNMTVVEFSKLTGLSARQIGYAETGKATNPEVYITVVAFKTGVDYTWLKTGKPGNGGFRLQEESE